MCGSLLSKFQSANNMIDPGMKIFPEPQQVASKMKLDNPDEACFQDGEFWKDGKQQGVSSDHSLAVVRNTSSPNDDSSKESDYSSQEEIEAAMRSLADERVSVPPPSLNKNHRLRAVGRDQRLLDTAYEILAFHAYCASSSSNTIRAIQPLSSTDSSLPQIKMQSAVAFDIPVGDKKTVFPPARVPQRFRKQKVAPEPTLEDIKEKMRAAEERKMKELHRVRECARSRAGVSRPHRSETSAQATAVKAAKQAAAESERNKELEKRKRAGNLASPNRSRIADAQAFAKKQLQFSFERKVDETVKRNEKPQQEMDEQNTLRGKYAEKIRDRVNFLYCYFVVRDILNNYFFLYVIMCDSEINDNVTTSTINAYFLTHLFQTEKAR